MLERDDALTWLSLRNVASVHLLAVDQLNTYDVLLSDDVIFTQGAYDAFVNGTAASSARKATIVEAPGNDAVVEDADGRGHHRGDRRTRGARGRGRRVRRVRPRRWRAVRPPRASRSRATRTR